MCELGCLDDGDDDDGDDDDGDGRGSDDGDGSGSDGGVCELDKNIVVAVGDALCCDEGDVL